MEEAAKEAARDEREARLMGAEILKTTVLYQGERRIMLNRVHPVETPDAGPSEQTTDSNAPGEPETITRSVEAAKESVHGVLSGTVFEDGISELLWTVNGERCRIVTNIDFTYFGGVSEFEDETTRYTVFSLVVPSPRGINREWAPASFTVDDFAPDHIEYIVLEESSDPDAFRGIEAMLDYYEENWDRMRVVHENSRILHQARRAYLEANPPTNRPVIINYVKD